MQYVGPTPKPLKQQPAFTAFQRILFRRVLMKTTSPPIRNAHGEMALDQRVRLSGEW